MCRLQKCSKECPADVITMVKRGFAVKAKKWYDYLWIAELLYLALGLTNILFAWLGMLFFLHSFINRLIWRRKSVL